MLRHVLAAASVISILTVGSAQAGHETNADYDVTGEVAAFGGFQWLNIDDGDDFVGALFGGAGRANLSFGNHWNAELEVLGESERLDLDGDVSFYDISVLPQAQSYLHRQAPAQGQAP